MYSLGKETYSVGAALSSEDVQVVVKPEPQKLFEYPISNPNGNAILNPDAISNPNVKIGVTNLVPH